MFTFSKVLPFLVLFLWLSPINCLKHKGPPQSLRADDEFQHNNFQSSQPEYEYVDPNSSEHGDLLYIDPASHELASSNEGDPEVIQLSRK